MELEKAGSKELLKGLVEEIEEAYRGYRGGIEELLKGLVEEIEEAYRGYRGGIEGV